MRQVTVAGLQLAFSDNRDADIAMTAAAVRAAAAAAGSQAPPEILMASPDLRSRRAQGDLLPRPL